MPVSKEGSEGALTRELDALGLERECFPGRKLGLRRDNITNRCEEMLVCVLVLIVSLARVVLLSSDQTANLAHN